MKIFPAIDLYEGNAVRLYKGNYNEMTVYSTEPLRVARDFVASGAECIHLVDLEGAKGGGTPNFDTVESIVKETSLFAEIGGGVRSPDVIEKYLSAGASRVILGTAAVTDTDMLERAVREYGKRVAVGVDIKDGSVAIKGWTETADISAFDFCRKLRLLGVQSIICTDVSKDGAMTGTNRELYRELSQRTGISIVASGGVSTLEDIRALAAMKLEGAIIGKAYYTGAINLKEAIELSRDN